MIHDTLGSSCILEVVLKCNIKVKSIASVSKPNAYERTAAYERNETNKQELEFNKGGTYKNIPNLTISYSYNLE